MLPETFIVTLSVISSDTLFKEKKKMFVQSPIQFFFFFLSFFFLSDIHLAVILYISIVNGIYINHLNRNLYPLTNFDSKRRKTQICFLQSFNSTIIYTSIYTAFYAAVSTHSVL